MKDYIKSTKNSFNIFTPIDQRLQKLPRLQENKSSNNNYQGKLPLPPRSLKS